METISLLPPEVKEAHQKKRQILILSLFSGFILIFFAIVYVSIMISITNVNSQIDETTSARENVQQEMASLEHHRELNDIIIHYENTLQQAIGDMPNWGTLMNNIGYSLPNEVWLSYFYMTHAGNDNENGDNEEVHDRGEITVIGYALNHTHVADWLDKLENNPRLTNIKLEYSEETTDEDRQVVGFEISARVMSDNFKSPLEREGL